MGGRTAKFRYRASESAVLPLPWFLVPVTRVSVIYVNPCKSNIASVPFVWTLESDGDVDQLDNDTDSDEEPKKPVKRAKTKKSSRGSQFEDDFQFFSGELEDNFQNPWNLDVAIKFAKRKQESNLNSSSLQDKIAKRRETRRKVFL